MNTNSKDTDWAWIAGFLDGDGCFTCSVLEMVSKKNGLHSITIGPRVMASQQEKWRHVLDHLVELTGCGKVYTKHEKSNRLNSSIQCMWTVGKFKEIEFVCKNILPFIYHKKRQCKILMRLVQERMKDKSDLNRFNHDRVPKEATKRSAKLALSLNPDATTGRNSRWNNVEKRTWEYWDKKIDEVYAEVDEYFNKPYNERKLKWSR
ncbi:MAG: LAGLIDADG family homing endonuclease [Candidatus Komeilibacteria bacterium]